GEEHVDHTLGDRSNCKEAGIRILDDGEYTRASPEHRDAFGFHHAGGIDNLNIRDLTNRIRCSSEVTTRTRTEFPDTVRSIDNQAVRIRYHLVDRSSLRDTENKTVRRDKVRDLFTRWVSYLITLTILSINLYNLGNKQCCRQVGMRDTAVYRWTSKERNTRWEYIRLYTFNFKSRTTSEHIAMRVVRIVICITETGVVPYQRIVKAKCVIVNYVLYCADTSEIP